MHLTQRAMIATVAAAAMFVSAGPAMAHMHSYSGTWPVTITGSEFDNGTGCLTFSGTGSSGSASLTFGSQKYPYGSFVVLNGILLTTITEPLYGQNGALMFITPAHKGHIGVGDFEDIRGGSNFQLGTVTFGMKNGC